MKHQMRVHSSGKSRSGFKYLIPPFGRAAGVIVGALLASVGLELFLMPHGIVVGGMTGLSALLALKTEMRLGLFLFLLNLPFLFLYRKNIHWSYGIFTVIGILVFSLGTLVLHPYPSLINEPLPAALIGGVSLGFGLGLSLRFGGALDIAEKAANQLQYRSLSPERLLLLLNCLILIGAGCHFGFLQALYSVIAYLSAFEAVKLPVQGGIFTQTVRIKSRQCAAIQGELLMYLNRSTVYRQEPEDTANGIGILECRCHRLERSRLISVVHRCDRESEITFHPKD
ncbi:MAG: YitT family protein [Paenibacillaceae bacterium]|uniref:YitT family protein n=1 Tax=Paenibacillus mellifer TaxID=2937794 RepID=A0A9X1Y407_9BACL|nr:YitT family protein [Paenibacillus mellifer]MBW4840488.1 YitT family protein [Paenibacillaceae bacterium]MCK8489266.1 YitT family protein [Paenibacillus mellifer]